jgi:hypothetical protein
MMHADAVLLCVVRKKSSRLLNVMLDDFKKFRVSPFDIGPPENASSNSA